MKKRNRISPPWAIAFWITALIMLIFMLAISNDYCLTNDEPIHQLHGEIILRHFQNGDSIATLSPFDDDGKLIQNFHAIDNEIMRGMNFFGGSFDLLVNALKPAFPDSGIYELRHGINAILGFLMMLFVGLIIRELKDWKWALLALLFAFLTPRLFGHSFNNPKDIPFALSYIAGIYFILRFLRRLPKISIPDAVGIAICIALGISFRVSGLLLIGYLGLGYLVYFLPKTKNNFWIILQAQWLPILVMLGIVIVGYLGTSLLWPYMNTDIGAPIKVLSSVSNFEVFNAYELFKGKRIQFGETPAAYIPVWLAITLPIFVLIGSIASLPLLVTKWTKEMDTQAVSLLFFVVLFPAVYIILQGSNIYNGIRHVLFIIPPLVALSTLGWQQLFQRFGNSAFQYTLILALSLSIIESAVWMVRSHPYQAMYFNSLSGGIDQAKGHYELDYWGISTKEAVEWIDANTPEKTAQNPVKIKMFYGDREKVSYYTDQIEGLEYIPGNTESGWHYEIVFVAASKFDETLLTNWPPERTVYEVKANGTALCAVVEAEELEIKIERLKREATTKEDFTDLSFNLYQTKDYIGCINTCKQAIQQFGEDEVLLNNIGAAYNALQMHHSAIPYLERSLIIDPNLENTRNNLNYAREAQMPENYNFYINASLNAYYTSDYHECIWYAEQSLRFNKNDAVAYNNICSAYNAMGEYKKAETACMKALRIQPDYELAKNNLNYCRQKLQNK